MPVTQNRRPMLEWQFSVGMTMQSKRTRLHTLFAFTMTLATTSASAQTGAAPRLPAGVLTDRLTMDGRLDEAAWTQAPAIDGLTQTDPAEGRVGSGRTRITVLANRTQISIVKNSATTE